MKIAFVADTHFGYPKYEADALAQGRAAILDACDKADVLVLGGDIFDHRIPKMETLSEVAQVLQEAGKKLSQKWKGAKDIPLVLGIHGTHERRAKDALNPIAMMAELGLMEDLHNKTITVEGIGDHGKTELVAFSGLGGIPDDLVKDAISRLTCKPVSDATNFFIFHQTLSEFVPAAKGLAAIEDLPAGYDWYLCGHIHGRREWMDGKLLIPGSTVMTQMKEEESQQKGYYVIDTSQKEGGRLGKAEFIGMKTRPFEVVELEFENAQPAQVRMRLEEEIQKQVQRQWEDKPIIKIRLKGSLAKGAGEPDLAHLEDARAFISIDNQLEGAGLAADLQRLREERMTRATPRELGMALLRENAVAAGLDAKKAEEYFEKFTKEE